MTCKEKTLEYLRDTRSYMERRHGEALAHAEEAGAIGAKFSRAEHLSMAGHIYAQVLTLVACIAWVEAQQETQAAGEGA